MCTTFCVTRNEQVFVGKNLDIFMDHGWVFTNQRNRTKTALILPPEQPASWTSRYGSVTFHQAGKEFPHGGMNEAGLVVEQMTLPETQYPAADGRPAITELQWIQLMLDTCGSTDEVLERAERIRIAQNTSTIHYFVADARGRTAVVEYIGGKSEIYTGSDLPVPALTNSSYADSLRYVAGMPVGSEDNDYVRNSLQRFATVSRAIRNVPESVASWTDYVFQGLREAGRSDTVWSIVYDLSNLTIHFITKKRQEPKTIALADLDFAGPTGKALDLNAGTEFVDYSAAINKALLVATFRNETFAAVMQTGMSDEVIDFLAGYPDRMA